MSPHTALPGMRARALIVVGVLACGLVLMVVKAARLQLNLGPDLKELAEQQYLRSLRFSAPRGNVYDREGRPLAVSVPVWSVSASPRNIDQPGLVAEKLAAALSLDAEDLEEKLSTERAFTWVERRVAPEVAEAVRSLDLEGVSLHRESKRFYPGRQLAGQLLGTVSIDGDGQSGVERAFDTHLRGRAVTLPGLRDNRGRRVLLAGGVDLELLGGDDVYLTLDARLQHVVEDALERGLERTKAKAGMAVVVDPRTGAIRAVANVPSFNPNRPGGGSARARRNHAFSDVFEPGSTFKTVTFAAALDEGVIAPADRMFCENGRFELGRFTVRDSHAEGWLTVREVFKYSSNICSLKIAQKLGEQRFRAAIDAFGFGQAPGLGFVEESPGLLPSQDRWGEVRLSTIGYGHGLSVTALQLAQALSIVAHDGKKVPLKILDRVQAPSGEIVREEPVGEEVQIIRRQTARTLADVMTTVFEDGGTASRARLDGVRAAGKTGTAEKVDPHTGRYSREKNTSSFIGFAPVDDPRVVAVVVLDEPEVLTSGGATAGPIWKEIVTAALVDEGVLTGTIENEPAGEKRPDAEEPVARAPTPPPTETADPGEGVTELLRGLSAREALTEAGALGFDVTLEGSGVVTEVRERKTDDERGARHLLITLGASGR